MHVTLHVAVARLVGSVVQRTADSNKHPGGGGGGGKLSKSPVQWESSMVIC